MKNSKQQLYALHAASTLKQAKQEKYRSRRDIYFHIIALHRFNKHHLKISSAQLVPL
jgi:hypothetical protein